MLYRLDFRPNPGLKRNVNSHVISMLEKGKQLREQTQYVIGIKL